MYEIYETKAYILKTLIRGESDQRVLLFTKDFGLIWVSVIGSKKEESKMRNFLQDLTFTKIFLVQGKTGYRITGGNFVENIFFLLQEKDRSEIFSKKIQSIKNMFVLFEKIFHKGEKEEKIFKLLETFVSDLKKNIDEKKVEEMEVIFLSKIFFLLGYLDEKDLLKTAGGVGGWETENFSEKQISDLRKKINENISKIAF